ncbi:MAG: zinc metalloprotease HtpX [Azospirillum sp.]|nr:zinc metalloprotease HtpX [Azospirillum sp.]
MNSYVKTMVLLAGMTALFVMFGGLIGGRTGMMFAFVAALVMNLIAWWNSGEMVLNMYGAREVSVQTAPQLFGIVQQLAFRAGLPMPRVFVIESDQPNAFATGRDPRHAAVAATTGLLNRLSQNEVAGVIAHELAHVKNRDTLIMTITATLAGAIAMMANFGMFFGAARSSDERNDPGPIATILLAILAPLAAMLVQMAISRTREYEADRIGAQICGQPNWLANALTNLHAVVARVENPVAETHPTTAHLFIVNPLHRGGAFAGLFSTHPPMDERVRRLRRMAGSDAPPPGSATPRYGTGRTTRHGPWSGKGSGSSGPWG